MNPFRTSVLLLALVAGHANAQPKGGEVQPDRLAFGAVYPGATVEGSFLVFEGGKDATIKLEVTAPKFVKVLHKATHTQQYGPGNDFVCGSVELGLDTSVGGVLEGEVRVTLGQTTARVPVSAVVYRQRPGLTRLLIAETPFDRYSTNDGGAFKVWTDLARRASVDVSYLLVTKGKPVLRNLDLSKFDGVLLAGTGLVYLTATDVDKVRTFAEAGGRVTVAANAFFVGTVKQANTVLAGYGLEMRNEEARGRGQNDVTLGEGDLDHEVVKTGVSKLHFFRASPVAVTDAKRGRVLVKAVGAGQAEDGFVAIADAGKGKVIALGQSLWWNWISEKRAAGSDNDKLLRWLLVPPKGKGAARAVP